MSPWCVALVCSCRRLLADRHWLPFPWTLSFRGRWCPLASHRPVSILFLLDLSFPLYFPFLSLGRSLGRPYQRSPRTFLVSLLCVGSTQRRANVLAVGRVRPSGPSGWGVGRPPVGLRVKGAVQKTARGGEPAQLPATSGDNRGAEAHLISAVACVFPVLRHTSAGHNLLLVLRHNDLAVDDLLSGNRHLHNLLHKLLPGDLHNLLHNLVDGHDHVMVDRGLHGHGPPSLDAVLHFVRDLNALLVQHLCIAGAVKWCGNGGLKGRGRRGVSCGGQGPTGGRGRGNSAYRGPKTCQAPA